MKAIVFPGQGAAKSCMKNIRNTFEIQELKEVINKKFFLGICMGLQVLMTESEEGDGEKCLDIFSGRTRYLGDFQNRNLTLPHMGWNNVVIKNNHPILSGINNESFFYSLTEESYLHFLRELRIFFELQSLFQYFVYY